MIWPILHIIANVSMVIIAVFMLSRWRDVYNASERVGLGLIGGCGLMRVNVIWEVGRSPFYQWAPTLMTVGFALLLAGRAWRDWGHEWRNDRANRQAGAYLRAKGKL